MAWFLVEIRYIPEKFAAARPAHRQFLRKLADEGTVAVAGPIGDDEGGLALYQAEDEQALQQIIDADPYHLEGAIAERTVRPFNPVIGAWVP